MEAEITTQAVGLTSTDFSILKLFLRADIIVKSVILILIAASIFSWAIIIEKHNGKVPFIKGNFQSVNVNNLFFAGALSQEISYKYGSAAFIHGFRYLASSMIKIVFSKSIFIAVNEFSLIFSTKI